MKCTLFFLFFLIGFCQFGCTQLSDNKESGIKAVVDNAKDETISSKQEWHEDEKSFSYIELGIQMSEDQTIQITDSALEPYKLLIYPDHSYEFLDSSKDRIDLENYADKYLKNSGGGWYTNLFVWNDILFYTKWVESPEHHQIITRSDDKKLILQGINEHQIKSYLYDVDTLHLHVIGDYGSYRRLELNLDSSIVITILGRECRIIGMNMHGEIILRGEFFMDINWRDDYNALYIDQNKQLHSLFTDKDRLIFKDYYTDTVKAYYIFGDNIFFIMKSKINGLPQKIGEYKVVQILYP